MDDESCDPEITVSFNQAEQIPTADIDARAAYPDAGIAEGDGDYSVPLPYAASRRQGTPAVAQLKVAPVPPAPVIAPTLPETGAVSGAQAISPVAQPQIQPSPADAQKEPVTSSVSAEEAAAQSSPAVELIREITTGSVLRDRYLVEHVVGIGGNSVVFQAIDRHRESTEDAGARVAVKVLRPTLRNNPFALMRMRREFRQMQRLTHSGIARVFDLDCDGAVWFMTLELVEGQTITQWMKTGGSDAEAMQIITGCCEAVSYAHGLGIVHGDLKPSNVLVTPGTGIKLVDFGSAAAEATGAAIAVAARSFAATPPYASPQILTGNLADPRDDVFSLACIAYAVLTRGEHPFERKSSLDAYRDQMRPTYSAKIQPRVFDVIVRGLSWQRQNRPASASEFLSALIGNDLGRDSRPVNAPAPAVTPQLPATLPVAIPDPARSPVAHGFVQSVPLTLDVPEARRHGLPAQWLAIQPWNAMMDWKSLPAAIETPMTYDTRSYRISNHSDAAPTDAPPAIYLAAALLVQLARPEPPALQGEVLMRAPAMNQMSGPTRQRAAHVRHPSIWHRHGLAAVAVVGVLVILLGHETDVGSSTTAAESPRSQIPAPTTTAITVAAVRETIEPTQAPAEPNIVEHVVPPPPVPAAPGFISFENATVQVGSNQSMAVLTVRRLDSTRGRARIAWSAEGGSANAVIDDKAIESQTIQFLDGQDVRSLYIPLLTPDDPGSHQPTRSFTVKLKKIEGSPAIGPLTQAQVMIASGY